MLVLACNIVENGPARTESKQLKATGWNINYQGKLTLISEGGYKDV